MAVPTYTTDLTDIDDGSGTFTEPAGAVQGTLSLVDTDNFIQGTNAVTKTWGNSGAPNLAGIGILDAGAHTIASPNAYYCWVFVGAGALIDTLANGGIRLIIGQDINNYRYWYVDGSEYFPYIGWQCIAVETDNAVVAATGSQGTPSATKQYFGAVFRGLVNIGKGNPLAIDALRWGRTITILGGEDIGTPNYATFAGCATTNDSINNKWGQFQAVAGGYQLQGKLLLGTTGSTIVDFRDSNRSIVIAISRKTATSFNAIEIQNTSSRVDWDSCVFKALGTNSRGTVTVTDNADVNITSCSFTDMDTFSFLAASSVLDSTFRGCNAITAAGSDMTGSQVLVPTVAADTSSLIWNVATNPNGLLDNMTFSKGANAHHAIEFGTSAPTSITLNGITFTGFSGTNGNNDSTLNFTDGSGKNYTVNVFGGTSPSYKVAGTSTVTIVSNPVTTLINIKDPDGNNEAGVRVYLEAADASGDLPYQQSISSITRSGSGPGSTATVTFAAAHGLKTNEYLKLYGITDTNNQSDLSGAFQVTVTGTTTLTYPTDTTGPSPYNGTITGTGATIYGTTDANGNISSSRTYTVDQPLTGYARKSDDGVTYFKPIDLDDTVNSINGLTINRRLISDGLV